jgi:hypothetical protein
MPDTDTYLLMGLAVTGSVLGVYIVSLLVRFANMRKLINVLDMPKDS